MHFKGFISPRYTQVPDELFDDLMAHLSGAELKVLLYIIRRTFGFKKDTDNISLNQICNGIKTREGDVLDKGTGLSLSTVQIAIRGLLEKNCVLTVRNRSKKKGDEPTTYSLNILPYYENRQGGIPKIGNAPPRKSVTQETVLQQTVIQDTVANGEFKKLKNLNEPQEKIEYVTQEILKQLGDKHSEKFYRLVAAKIPENIIRETLSEIKTDGARNPAKVFTHRMKLYALKQQKRKIGREIGE